MSENKPFKVTVMSRVPTDAQGNSVVDIYVRLPSRGRYVRWVRMGNMLRPEQRQKLLHHPDPRLYCPSDQWATRYERMAKPMQRGHLIGADIQEMVSDLIIELLDDQANVESVSDSLCQISSKITDTIASDLKEYQSQMQKHVKDLSRLVDAEAIRGLCVLFALANGYNSKKIIGDISAATMVMDMAHLDFTEKEIEQCLLADHVDKDLYEAYKRHPLKAYLFASEKLKFVSEVALWMIQNHHELHNGLGYPRGLRTKQQQDLVKILALAVDVFEHMKRAELRGQKSNMIQALRDVYGAHLDPHERRHQRDIVENVFKHLNFPLPG